MGFNGGQAAKGAMGGAAVGGMIGGPGGALIGGAAGGLLGGFGGGGEQYNPNRGSFDVPQYGTQYERYRDLSYDYGNRNAPQMGESSFRRNQQGLVGMLEAQARGRGPGQALVRMQAQKSADQAMRQQLALAQGAAPGGGAQAARSAALAGGQAQQAVGGQAAQAGLQAQLGAVGMLGSTLQGARGQDLQRGQANMQAQLQQTGMNDQAQLEALRQRLQLTGMQQGGAMGYESLRAGQPVQPGMGDYLMGAGMGAGQTMMMRGMGGGQPQPMAGQPSYSTPYGGNNQQPYGFNPYAY